MKFKVILYGVVIFESDDELIANRYRYLKPGSRVVRCG
jgi:hypothetical protein